MKILPVAFDSLGARSMATYVETKDIRVFIDPGVRLSPDRYSLPPHQIELKTLAKLWEEIKRWVLLSDIVIVTHYHYDHHNPDEPEIYDKKELFIKNPREFINESQRKRAEYFLARIEDYASSINIADGKNITIGSTKVTFSEPVYHGISGKLGYVILVLIEEDSKFLFSSDVQGPLNEEAVRFIIKNNPKTLFLDGPPTYLLGTYYKNAEIERALENIKTIIKETEVENLVIDHHLPRDLNWCNYINFIKDIKGKTIVQTAARFRNEEENLLEARRKDLYEKKLPVVDNYG
uniref:Uncharacterized protein n=1 Tax=candidate division WOR-3 bacterium TaxID=2052148 RepID=A0A7C4TDN4_UNCW3